MKTSCPSTLTVMGSWNPHTPPGIPLQRQVQSLPVRGQASGICLVPAVCTALCQIPQVNQDVSRQLLQDGYHLDEIPDDEDLDLIPPKSVSSSTCSCCWCCLGDSSSCNLQ
ncbi:family with sequence similarity 219 member B [Rhinolophus ferrumequinum]|uniref:Family with sequence similarity 219 member B n=1 Tax=Rhinolophus ferrumequinum TaxID=59479 RepID=A0A7J7XNL3_RHIFE|nr:family with sequence similarity 219 member B [Rhinolophus ferrumequinum]